MKYEFVVDDDAGRPLDCSPLHQSFEPSRPSLPANQLSSKGTNSMQATVKFDDLDIPLDFYESIRRQAQQGLARLSSEAYGFCTVRELFSRRGWREFSVDEQRLAASCVYAMAVTGVLPLQACDLSQTVFFFIN
jgi:hypothetical protein